MPRMSIPQRGVAVLVVLVVLIGAAALAVRGLDPGVGANPSASSSPTSNASASPPPSPSGSVSADDAAVFAEIEAAVEANRGLPPAEIGPPELIRRDELGVELEAIFAEEYPPDEQRRDETALRALGLLTEEQEIAALQLQLLGDQVLGFYDDIDERMVVVSDVGIDAESKITYAHEYTHALQDAAFDLTALQDAVADDDDRSLALIGLIEGDAVLSMLSWAINGGLTPEELLALTEVQVPDTTGIPGWMVAQLEFPYTAGFEWASQVAGEDPLTPDWAALDAAFADPPASTEQVLHFEKWEAQEAPIAVEVPDLAAALGAGWEAVDTTTVGEAMIGDALTFLGVEGDTADAAAAGWGGDRVTVATGPDDAFGLVWRLAWDSQADADEFVAAYETAQEALPFASDLRVLNGGEVLVAHASSGDLVARALDAAAE
jgi:hypothetical protein